MVIKKIMSEKLEEFDEDLENEFVEETLNDLKSQLNSSNYVFGKEITKALPEDIAEAIEFLYYIKQHNSPVIVNISKDIDNYHLKFEILNK